MRVDTLVEQLTEIQNKYPSLPKIEVMKLMELKLLNRIADNYNG